MNGIEGQVSRENFERKEKGVKKEKIKKNKK